MATIEEKVAKSAQDLINKNGGHANNNVFFNQLTTLQILILKQGETLSSVQDELNSLVTKLNTLTEQLDELKSQADSTPEPEQISTDEIAQSVANAQTALANLRGSRVFTSKDEVLAENSRTEETEAKPDVNASELKFIRDPSTKKPIYTFVGQAPGAYSEVADFTAEPTHEPVYTFSGDANGGEPTGNLEALYAGDIVAVAR